jgi:hypothetical protein
MTTDLGEGNASPMPFPIARLYDVFRTGNDPTL